MFIFLDRDESLKTLKIASRVFVLFVFLVICWQSNADSKIQYSHLEILKSENIFFYVFTD